AELLAPRDPNDSKDVLLEVKAGEGGEESALFAADLLRMYLRDAQRKGRKTQVLDSTATGPGGYKAAPVPGSTARPRPPGGGGGGGGGGGEVRRRGAPGPAGAGHRVPGPDPHLGGRGAGAARGRPGRGDHRPRRPARGRVPVLRARRAEREHHRLRGADHPPA